jgi:hypothetical protein
VPPMLRTLFTLYFHSRLALLFSVPGGTNL